jgi:hypothetical protein
MEELPTIQSTSQAITLIPDPCPTSILDDTIASTSLIEMIFPDEFFTIDPISVPTDTESFSNGDMSGLTYCGDRELVVQD